MELHCKKILLVVLVTGLVLQLQLTEGAFSCNDGAVRLQGGRVSTEGRIEICIGNQYGTICNRGWDNTDATVACKFLGYQNGHYYCTSSAIINDFDKGSDKIMLESVDCAGNESSLLNCSHSNFGYTTCNHSQDAGVRCEGRCSPNGRVRLANGSSPYEGRVEVCFDGVYGTICDDYWDNNDATVVCKQLGYKSTGAISLAYGFFGAGQGPIHDIECNGSEKSLSGCILSLSSPNSTSCVHHEDAGILCSTGNNSVCENGQVRLAGSNDTYQGRVEVCLNDKWGTVCHDRWELSDAQVVCRQLGFNSTALSAKRAYFGEGTGPIFLDNVNCQGNEANLISCPTSEHGFHNCFHDDDAGVICAAPNSLLTNPQCRTGDLRLVGGSLKWEGRVEICFNGQWGTICDDLWSEKEAIVVCRQLGYIDGRKSFTAKFAPGVGPIFLDNMDCSGNESTLLMCKGSGTGNGCSHDDDAGVTCRDEKPVCTDGDLILADGHSPNEGRVEVCTGGWFRTVCDIDWDNQDAAVVCKQLGYQGEGAIGLLGSFFGPGNSRLLAYMTRVDCFGDEKQLLDCPFSKRITPIICAHIYDASVLCPNSSSTCRNGQVQLAGGQGEWEGTVEVCFNGRWGAICEDHWDNKDAAVICRQLGHTQFGALATTGAHHALGQGPIFLDNVNCTGSEAAILACRAEEVGVHNCYSGLEAGVICPVSQPQGSCRSGALRLVGGAVPNEGRVEICVNGKWGQVCDSNWTNIDASVVCQQVGYGANEARIKTFGQGTGDPYLSVVTCNGNETRLLDCENVGPGRCEDRIAAGVMCKAPLCYEWDVRLQDGDTPNEGRIEVCLNKQWGRVCDSQWTNEDAAVVCKQLGYKGEGAVGTFGAHFGRGHGPISLSGFRCTGNESRLEQCRHLDEFLCFDGFIAGVICPLTNASCSNGEVRLAGRPVDYEGRVEICLNGKWGTVCDDDWDNREAEVVCRQLGFVGNKGYSFALRGSFFGEGSGLIFLDDLKCQGNETNLLQCLTKSIGQHDCHHREDAGVICPASNLSCENGQLQLVGRGDNADQGRVEICLSGIWGTICDDNWDDRDAEVVCRQLGLNFNRPIAVTRAGFGSGRGPIYTSAVDCEGSESSLVNCPQTRFGSTELCTHREDAGVICLADNFTCNEGEIKLIGGALPTEGRVEVCIGNEYGTICDDGWDTKDATVVCRQLGFSTVGAVGAIAGHFGEGVGHILLDNVDCIGNETSLLDCGHEGVSQHNCIHKEDTGIICQVENPSCRYGDIRLLGGEVDREGRVEVCFGGHWGTVCDNEWDQNDASVVCSQLGYSHEGAISSNAALFGRGSGPIFLDQSMCIGNESRLIDCQSTGAGVHECNHLQDAGVHCQVVPCEEGQVRLVGGATNSSGTVEVCIEKAFQSVCDRDWTHKDVQVVCKQLGLNTEGAVPVTGAFFGEGKQQVNSGSYNCNGTEKNLMECSSKMSDTVCSHKSDAGVICQVSAANCSDGSVRLSGTKVNMEGRVEVCLGGEWGTVCDDSWDNMAATVVCTQLGYSPDGAETLSDGPVSDNLPILLDDVKCKGTEASLLQCNKNPLRQKNNCDHSEDVWVRCQLGTSPTTISTSAASVSPAAIVIPIIILLILLVAIVVLGIIFALLFKKYKDQIQQMTSLRFGEDTRSDVVSLAEKTDSM